MFTQGSLTRRFIFQLIVASSALLLIFSSILYLYIQNSIYSEKQLELQQLAERVSNYQSLYEVENSPESSPSVSLELITLNDYDENDAFYEYTQDRQTYLVMVYPFDASNQSYLKITRNISITAHLLDNIRRSIFIINALGFLLIIVFAMALSRMLLSPIITLSRRLSTMNENIINPITIGDFPTEFAPLGETVNRLIVRLQNYVKYHKELFIGAAHELKTPLAVIKLKNQVTLIKKRSAEEYIDAIHITNKSVGDLNKIIDDILQIGRQESAQLETPVDVNIIELLQQKADDFKLLAESENKHIVVDFQPSAFMASLQLNLFHQIIQNFLQNALKFTAEDRTVLIRTRMSKGDLLIEVIDEGIGIDESVDLFAPFKREGNKSGVGLGLFLAKTAADGLGAEIMLRNRRDGKEGTVASLLLGSKLACKLPRKS